MSICYQCSKVVDYLFDDGRCGKCTRLTPEEVVGNVIPGEECGYCGDSQDPNSICKTCWDDMHTEEPLSLEDYQLAAECNSVPSTNENG